MEMKSILKKGWNAIHSVIANPSDRSVEGEEKTDIHDAGAVDSVSRSPSKAKVARMLEEARSTIARLESDSSTFSARARQLESAIQDREADVRKLKSRVEELEAAGDRAKLIENSFPAVLDPIQELFGAHSRIGVSNKALDTAVKNVENALNRNGLSLNWTPEDWPDAFIRIKNRTATEPFVTRPAVVRGDELVREGFLAVPMDQPGAAPPPETVPVPSNVRPESADPGFPETQPEAAEPCIPETTPRRDAPPESTAPDLSGTKSTSEDDGDFVF